MKTNLHYLLVILLVTAFSLGCSEKTGIMPEPQPEPNYVVPTIGDLQVRNNNISKCGGGIMTLACTWTSPYKVATATAYLGFVKTITDPVTEPVGVIATQGASLRQSPDGFLFQALTDCNASDTAAFFARYAKPIEIPTKVGTDQLTGRWEVGIPFAPADTRIAPLGVYQMILYMKINHVKTNTLSFEMTFLP